MLGKRASVEILEGQCWKTVYKKAKGGGPKESYAIKAMDDDGTNVTKFLKKHDFDKLNCPQK
jgi:hypothetical protein